MSNRFCFNFITPHLLYSITQAGILTHAPLVRRDSDIIISISTHVSF